MVAKIIFCSAVTAATVAVILLALLPPPKPNSAVLTSNKPPLTLTFYVQNLPSRHRVSQTMNSGDVTKTALVFHHILTDGPENGSRVIGEAQGFVIPTQTFAFSAFNIIHLSFQTEEYSGSLSVDSREVLRRHTEVLTVVGGTGSFAFARGSAIFKRLNHHYPRRRRRRVLLYHLKLRLIFPDY
ncbi:Disease resistance-responsive (Dirigent-like protein) familyprotein [Zostera marina]|uniref:Dirigent protein n=1 Tax=Zostera marina TaxID=29655 RepID=A0A0K9P6G0_ZOSMR|nr:Disease resistance-responsive (Dirigent-like protein) familyprotein [Zostera marina]